MMSESAILDKRMEVFGWVFGSIRCPSHSLDLTWGEGGRNMAELGGSWWTFDRQSRGWNRAILLKIPANQRPE
jgi:hypothetical protein